MKIHNVSRICIVFVLSREQGVPYSEWPQRKPECQCIIWWSRYAFLSSVRHLSVVQRNKCGQYVAKRRRCVVTKVNKRVLASTRTEVVSARLCDNNSDKLLLTRPSRSQETHRCKYLFWFLLNYLLVHQKSIESPRPISKTCHLRPCSDKQVRKSFPKLLSRSHIYSVTWITAPSSRPAFLTKQTSPLLTLHIPPSPIPKMIFSTATPTLPLATEQIITPFSTWTWLASVVGSPFSMVIVENAILPILIGLFRSRM